MSDVRSHSEELLEEIGPWTEIKLEIIRKYARAYSVILRNQATPRLTHVYIDAFAGAGRYIARQTGLLVPGSTEIALATDPPFRHYYFVDIDDLKYARLEQLAEHRTDVTVFHGDCNTILVNNVLSQVRWEQFRRGLCILDPYGLHPNWSTVAAAAAAKTVEVFINFPTMDMNRNVLWRDPARIDQGQAERMTQFWGDESWRTLFYAARPQLNLWGEQREAKAATNEAVADAYRKRLQQVAGFAYVPEPLSMRNSTNAILYYLFFASHKAVAGDVVEQIFDTYR
jgi:three-Cys-motif partner protein